MASQLTIRKLGMCEYEHTFQLMKQFTDSRGDHDNDEFWVLQHAPVYTLGKNSRPEHIRLRGHEHLVQSDRGGQVTYHGPGQLMLYTLLDMQRLGLGVRELVSCLEKAVIELLETYTIRAEAKRDAPGVYVDGKKIAALGLRVRKGCSYHGLCLNVDMDLSPFQYIDPCGYEGLEVTQMANLGVEDSILEVENKLLTILQNELGYPSYTVIEDLGVCA